MSQSGNPSPSPDGQINLPPIHRPHWNLWRTAFELAASVGLVSGVIQIEQRLFPTLLNEPEWIAPVVYLGAACLPLLRLFYLSWLELRCAWKRTRWYGEVYRRAGLLTAEIDVLRLAARNREHLISEQRDELEQQATFIDRTYWLVPNLHRTRIVETVAEEGRLILIADSQSGLRVVVGDTFIVAGRMSLTILGEFRFTQQSERAYHLHAVRIQDNVWWAAVRQASLNGTLAANPLFAVLKPSPSPDLE